MSLFFLYSGCISSVGLQPDGIVPLIALRGIIGHGKWTGDDSTIIDDHHPAWSGSLARCRRNCPSPPYPQTESAMGSIRYPRATQASATFSPPPYQRNEKACVTYAPVGFDFRVTQFRNRRTRTTWRAIAPMDRPPYRRFSTWPSSAT